MKIVVVTRDSGNKLGEFEFPAVPRVGELITLSEHLGTSRVATVNFRVRPQDDTAEIEIAIERPR